jgi:hypothetical protein
LPRSSSGLHGGNRFLTAYPNLDNALAAGSRLSLQTLRARGAAAGPETRPTNPTNATVRFPRPSTETGCRRVSMPSR